jgi:hypothetical protein
MPNISRKGAKLAKKFSSLSLPAFLSLRALRLCVKLEFI